jgi:hypothetical protein
MALESYGIGLASFIVYVFLFLAALRFKGLRLGWLTLEIVTGLGVHAVATLLGFQVVQNFNYWYSAALFGFLWFCFFFVTGIFFVSISVGMIYHLYQKPDHSATTAELYQVCITRPFVERAQFLVDSGQAETVGSGFQITPAGKRNSVRIQRVRKILGLDVSGFYSTSESK